MRHARTASITAGLCLLAGMVFAQDRITPLPSGSDSVDDAVLSTHPVKKDTPTPSEAAPVKPEESAVPAPLPWKKMEPATSAAAPFGKPSSGGAAPAGKVPFGHASMPLGGPNAIPAGPHDAVAVPVGNVDAVTASEPAPPTPPPPGANPAKEDPALPTELTSPIFVDDKTDTAPRRVVILALNKVTGQSSQFKLKPGETVQFGLLDITAIMCRASAPNSQPDYAGLLDVHERLPDKEGVKPIFRGWMYASSPSVTALEHPIYDLTMVDCDIESPADKAKEKPEKKDDAPKKK